jgi:long-subunit fatty acid transport protein
VKQVARRQKRVVKAAALGAMSVISVWALSSSTAQAAGYYVGEIGARSMARGGANTVNPGDPSATWLNPAAITLVSGVQLQLDGNFVQLNSEFTRDCGGVANGCAVLNNIDRRYTNQDGSANAQRAYFIEGGKRVVGAPRLNGDQVASAEPGQLGNRNEPSRFDGATAVSNQAGIQPIPRLFATFNTDSIGLDGFAIGAFAYAPSAGDYSFSANGPTRYTLIDRDIYELFYGVTLGYRFGDWIAVGGSLQGVSTGLNQNLSLTADPTGNEDENYDVTVRIQAAQHLIPSGNFGVWSNPLKALTGGRFGDLEIGASVQLPRYVKMSGPINIEKFGDKLQSEFIDGGLATVSDTDASATVEFVMPPMYRVGLKYGQDDVFGDGKKTVGFNVEGNFVYEAWSTYDHVFITTKGLTTSTATEPDPKDLPPIVQPKDWVDAMSLRAGGTLALFDKMIEVHGGGFFETSAIPNSTYSVELVDGDKVGLGIGVSGKFNGVRLDVGYGHVFVFDRIIGTESIVAAGNVVVPPPIAAEGELRTRVAMGTYRASYNMLNAGVTVAFDDLFNFGKYEPRAVGQPVPVVPVAAASTDPTIANAPVASVVPSVVRLPNLRTIE